VLFQLVTGRPAFDAPQAVQVSLAVLTQEAPLLRQYAPHAPPELEAIVNRCLTKDPRGRFQSAAELAEALHPFASEPTRDSLQRLAQAKAATSLHIALDAASIAPGSAYVHARASRASIPSPDAVPVPGREGTPSRAPSSPSSPSITERASSSPAFPAPTLSSSSLVPAPPSSLSPLAPPSSPSSLSPGAPSSSAVGAGGGRSGKRRSSRTLPLVIVVAGLGAVLLGFALLSAAKSAGQAIGVLPNVATEPPAAAQAAPAVKRPPRPSAAITVTLDAGRAPP